MNIYKKYYEVIIKKDMQSYSQGKKMRKLPGSHDVYYFYARYLDLVKRERETLNGSSEEEKEEEERIVSGNSKMNIYLRSIFKKITSVSFLALGAIFIYSHFKK